MDEETKKTPPEYPPLMGIAKGPAEHDGPGKTAVIDNTPHDEIDGLTTYAAFQQDPGPTTKPARHLSQASYARTTNAEMARIKEHLKQPKGVEPPNTDISISMRRKHGGSDTDNMTNTTDIDNPKATSDGTRTRADKMVTGQSSISRANNYMEHLKNQCEPSTNKQTQGVSHGTVQTDDGVTISKRDVNAEKRDEPHHTVGHQDYSNKYKKPDDNDSNSSILTAEDKMLTSKQGPDNGSVECEIADFIDENKDKDENDEFETEETEDLDASFEMIDGGAITILLSNISINDSKDEEETDHGYFQISQKESQSKTDRSQDRNEDSMVNTLKVTAHGTYNMNESTSDDELPQSALEINATENINQTTSNINQPRVTETNEITTRSGIRAEKYNEGKKQKVMTDDPHEERQSGRTPPLPPKSHEPGKKQTPTDEPTPLQRKTNDKTSPTSQSERSPGPPEVYRDGDPATKMNSKRTDKSIKSGQGQLTPGHVQPVVSETEGASSDLKRGASGPESYPKKESIPVAGKEVDKTEWEFPGGHCLMVVNDDATNCWKDVLVDVKIVDSVKSSSEVRIYEIGEGKKKMSVHIIQWEGGEQKEKHALYQEFENMLKLAWTYDCIDICIPITPVGDWPTGKYLKQMCNAVVSHLNNPDMLPLRVQLYTTNVPLYRECCDVTKHCLPVKRQSFQVDLIKGQLDACKADILVNTTNHDLQLDFGAVSKSLLIKAGKELQQECKRNYPRKIKSGEIAVTKGYRLQCDHVFHSALDKYNGSVRNLETFVMDCLIKAASMKCTSIAFPAIGTGNLSYPKHEVAAAMFNAVQRYEQINNEGSVEQVSFVIYPADQEAVRRFNEYQDKYKKQKGTSSTPYDQNESTTIRLGKINVKARLGTLDNCTTEAIMYLWEKKEFNGAKCGEHPLLKEAGKVVQKQFEDHIPTFYNDRDAKVCRITFRLSITHLNQGTLKGSYRYKVFSTAGGSLQYAVIVHAPCDDNFDSVMDAVRESICLLDEERMKSVSVWFPVQHPLLKHGDKLPEIIVAAVKEVQHLMLCLSDITIVVEGRHNVPKILQYFKDYGGRQSVTVKIIGKEEEIKRAKKYLKHYTATGQFENENEQLEGMKVCQQSNENQVQFLTQESDNVKVGVLQQEPSEQSECTESLPLEEITEFLTTSDNHYIIEPVFANNQEASQKDVETAGYDMLASNTTNPIVQGTSDTEMHGSIRTTNDLFDNAFSSKMLGSVIKGTPPAVPGSSDSDILGSITTTNQMVDNALSSDMLGFITTTNPIVQDTSDSSDEGEDIQLDTFEIVIRCKKRRGGWYPMKVLKAQNQEEALKMRYIFSENKHHKVTHKIESACNSVKIRLDCNAVDIECENVKPSVIEAILTHESVDLRVKDFSIGIEQCKKVEEVLTSNSPDFSDQTVSLYMESSVCYLVSPAHLFEANIEVFQQTHDLFSTLMRSQATKRKN